MRTTLLHFLINLYIRACEFQSSRMPFSTLVTSKKTPPLLLLVKGISCVNLCRGTTCGSFDLLFVEGFFVVVLTFNCVSFNCHIIS